eukprot:1047131-Pleurochrysis_carterae.AAC.1
MREQPRQHACTKSTHAHTTPMNGVVERQEEERQHANLVPSDTILGYETDILEVQVRPAVLGGRKISATSSSEALRKLWIDLKLPLPATSYTFLHATQHGKTVENVSVKIWSEQLAFQMTRIAGPGGFQFPLYE